MNDSDWLKQFSIFFEGGIWNENWYVGARCRIPFSSKLQHIFSSNPPLIFFSYRLLEFISSPPDTISIEISSDPLWINDDSFERK